MQSGTTASIVSIPTKDFLTIITLSFLIDYNNPTYNVLSTTKSNQDRVKLASLIYHQQLVVESHCHTANYLVYIYTDIVITPIYSSYS